MKNKTHRVATTDPQIDRAIQAAKDFAASPADRRASKAVYEPSGDRVALFLSDGVIVSIPRMYLQGLQHGTRTQLSNIQVLGGGTGLHWPELQADHYVPELLNQVFGTKRWMSELGRVGGASRSKAKVQAARANGLKGGRPRKSAAGVSEKRKKSA